MESGARKTIRMFLFFELATFVAASLIHAGYLVAGYHVAIVAVLVWGFAVAWRARTTPIA